MSDAECVQFLQWALPQLHASWRGFRKVRRQVCKRIEQRRRELALADLAAYRAYLETHPDEWGVLDDFCRITISRFYRDIGVFRFLEQEVLPALASQALDRGAEALETWSAGCASGEEPYTVVLMWELALAPRFPGLALRVLATDLDPVMLRRADEATYTASSLKDLPERWRSLGFVSHDGFYSLRPGFKRCVSFLQHDVREAPPGGPFDLVLCRNLAFTYFDLELQREVASRLAECLRPGGALVVGAHEALPEGLPTFLPWSRTLGVYRLALAAFPKP